MRCTQFSQPLTGLPRSSPALLSSVLSTQLRGGLSGIEVPEFECDVQSREVSCNWKVLPSRYFAEKKMAKEALDSKVGPDVLHGAVLLGATADEP